MNYHWDHKSLPLRLHFEIVANKQFLLWRKNWKAILDSIKLSLSSAQNSTCYKFPGKTSYIVILWMQYLVKEYLSLKHSESLLHNHMFWVDLYYFDPMVPIFWKWLNNVCSQFSSCQVICRTHISNLSFFFGTNILEDLE